MSSPARGYTDDLRLAHLLADDADSLAMSRFRARDLTITTKADATAVTDADQAIETAIRKALATARPRDAVHGEESEDTGWGPRRWIVDPIDGTANFLRGVPVWATLIALMVDEVVRVGVVSAPGLGRRWWAAEGDGAYTGKTLFNGQPLHVSGVDSVGEAFLSYASLGGWMDTPRARPFANLLHDCGRTRAFGDFWSYMLVAEGAVDLATEPELALYDMAALDVIVREAGGRFTNLEGKPGPFGPGALATNGVLHEDVLARLAPA